MARNTYTPEFKVKIVLEVLQGERELGEIAAENNLNPNMVRNWKKEFLENASSIFADRSKEAKKAKREEAALKKQNNMYLTAVIDWYSRKIVGWNLSDTLSTQPVLQAVQEAVERFGTSGILNSDQGCQFTSAECKRLLKDLHIRQSMDGKSRWADNIMIERWFRSLKTELIYINEFHSPKHLRMSIRDYIEIYNSARPHEALDYETPDAAYKSCFSDSVPA